MPAIPIDTVVAHLHGIAVESIEGLGIFRPTGGGAATIDIVHTAEGMVRVAITFAPRTVSIEVTAEQWDAVLKASAAVPSPPTGWTDRQNDGEA